MHFFIESKQNIGVERLRILSIHMIVLCHLIYFANNGTEITGINGLFSDLFHGVGNLGVTIFILISGYFSVGSLKINKERLFKIIFQKFFIVL